MSNQQRHNYEYPIDVEAQTAAAKVVRMVGSNKRVLEIGAGPGSISRLLRDNNCSVTGIEIDSSAIEKLSEFCEKVYQCDLNEPDWASRLSAGGTYDVLVAADVFEHLYWPHQCLAALKPFFAPDGYLVVSLPHMGNNAIIASILAGDFEYRDWGLLDRTHIRFFGLKNMQDLMESAGYKIIAAEFVITQPDQTELASHWHKLNLLMRYILKTRKNGSIYQVVMKVVPRNVPGDGICLEDLPVPSYTFKDRAVARWRIYFSPKFRQFVKRLLTK